MTGPTGWRGKFLAVGLLIAVALAVYGLVVEPVAITFVAHRDSIADSKQLLARYRALDASRADLAADIAEMKQRSSREGDYFEAATESLAGAEIQALLGTLFQRHGATQRSVQTLPSKTTGGFVRVNVRTQFTTERDGLHRLLHEIETRTPLMFVKNVDIRRKQNRRRRRNRDDDASQEAGTLDVRLNLYAYMRGPTL